MRKSVREVPKLKALNLLSQIKADSMSYILFQLSPDVLWMKCQVLFAVKGKKKYH